MKKEWTGERLETNIFNEATVEHLHRYAIAIDHVENKRVLDIASGAGYGSNLLASKASSVIGADIDPLAIKQAQEKYKAPNLTFLTADVMLLPFQDHLFDVVVCFETLEHVDDHLKMIGEIKRVLKPGGLLFISTPDKKNYSDIPGYNNPFHVKELYEHEFKELLAAHFKNTCFLQQRLALASMILLETTAPLKFYEGGFDKVFSGQDWNPGYFIGLASDHSVDAMTSSAFLANDTIQTAIRIKEREIRNTMSYRIGHFILFPFKLVARFFKK